LALSRAAIRHPRLLTRSVYFIEGRSFVSFNSLLGGSVFPSDDAVATH
jgi:hypothetical protein